MAAEIVPVRLGLTKGDLYTLWAPSWRDADDEWQGFLGKDEDLYAFSSVAELAAFVKTSTDNDLTDHPAWPALTEATAHRCDPHDDHVYDLVDVPEVVAAKPTEESVTTLLRALSIVQSLGSVCDLTPVAKFFNGNPVLGSLGGGLEAFAGRPGRKRWSEIETVIGRNWDGVLDSIDEIVTVPDVDAAAVEKAEAEMAEPAPKPEETDEPVIDDVAGTDGEDTDEEDALAAHAEHQLLGDDEDFWTRVGIDPIRIMTSSGTYYTLRCYVGDEPRFLGRNGRISVFGSERALARYLADEHESDLSSFDTYDDIRTAAIDGSLRIDVTEDNVYVLSGLADDLADGPDAVDREQLELVVELLRDVSDYAEDTSVDAALDGDQPLGRLVGYVLEPSGAEPSGPHAKAVAQWEKLEAFVESRLRTE
ncbi:protein export chaperone SatS [Mycolicibacterium grossiae]|uniref:Primosomal protein n=1 Tax=Mycolicibacterium grossiae TaxID=1552759 RepID=A0A1E8Q8D4_9MYCO|nr:primosomal protein [Mycolicibacterium grossiae]OFJ54370.1 primosomal protein [Mycolicibacterium grossiae]QEM45450.1 primosomal protein [Mycolicibacterium grossiae]